MYGVLIAPYAESVRVKGGGYERRIMEQSEGACEKSPDAVGVDVDDSDSFAAGGFFVGFADGGDMKAEEEYDISRRRFQISFSSEQQMEEYMQDTALLEQRLDNSMELINGIQPLEAVELVTVQQETETGNKPPYRLEYIYAPLEVVTGRFFTREEFENREKKIVAGLTTNRSTLPGDQMQVLGDVYTVIGLSSDYENRLIYDPALVRALSVERIELFLKQIPAASQIEQMQQILSEQFSGLVIEPPYQPSVSAKESATMQLLFAALFILSLLNVTFLYQYLLQARERQMQIMRICGARRWQCMVLFFTEILLLSGIAYGIAGVCSHFFMNDLLQFTTNGNYTYVLGYAQYIYVLLLYIATVFLVFFPFLIRSVRKIDMKQAME